MMVRIEPFRMSQAAPHTDLTPVADERLGKKVGPYVLHRRIGQGGMGVVYEAEHEHIGQRAAVKILMRDLARDARVLQRFLDEAKAMTMVQHEGIVKVFDYGQLPDGVPYILMEYLEGQSLQARLSQATNEGSGLPVSSALEIARQVASAIAALHQKKIVHRDLKPDNLILVRDSLMMGGERVKLLDFGLAKVMNQQVRRTTDGSILGTPLYMSPEQWEGGRRLGPKSDVYALGAMLFELLSGRPPFVEDTPAQLMFRHVNTEAPLLSDLATTVPPRLDGLLALMLAKGPATRPDMTEVQSLLTPLCLELAGRGPLACRQGVVVPASMGMSDGMGETLGAEPRALQADALRAAASALPSTTPPHEGSAFASSEALEPLISMGLRDPLSSPVPRDSRPLPALPKSADVPPAPSAANARSSPSSPALPQLTSPSLPQIASAEQGQPSGRLRSVSRDALIVEMPPPAARSTSLSGLSVSLPPAPQNRQLRWLFVGAGLIGLLLLSVGALALRSGRAKNQAAQRPSQVVVMPSPNVPMAPVVQPVPAFTATAQPAAMANPPSVVPVAPSDPAVPSADGGKAPTSKGKRRSVSKKQRVDATSVDDPMTVFREH